MSQIQNPAAIAEVRDSLSRLDQLGFAPLIETLKDPSVYTRQGRVRFVAVGRKMGTSPTLAKLLMIQARLALGGADASGGGNYLDNVAFTRLFRSRRKNHESICLGVVLIVTQVARSKEFVFADESEREDVQQTTIEHCIRKIPKFDRNRRNAFAYFTTIAFNRIRRQISAEAKRRAAEAPFSDCAQDSFRGHTRRSGRRLLHKARAYSELR